jgi:hypothetical protein
MRRSYGQKGGEGPNTGKRAVNYKVTLPDARTVTKRDFNPPANPTGYAYQHAGIWYLAAIDEPDAVRFKNYTQCPAVEM